MSMLQNVFRFFFVLFLLPANFVSAQIQVAMPLVPLPSGFVSSVGETNYQTKEGVLVSRPRRLPHFPQSEYGPVFNPDLLNFDKIVYLSPVGSDTNDGSESAPVKTFSRAVDLLPFGMAGVNGGAALGLVRLLPGVYFAPAGMVQREDQWKQGNTYKQVSVEGVGAVEIVGNLSGSGGGHGLLLRGSNIYVRDITIRNSSLIGLLITRDGENPDSEGPHDIWIEHVTVDSTGSHGMLFRNADRVLVRDARILRASRANFDQLDPAFCSAWPSGLKFEFCKDVTVVGNEVAFTRGEGLNFHSCERGEAASNRLHDNLTQLYNDNSSRLVVRQNYLYNSEGAFSYYYPCPQQVGQSRQSGAGILLGNEGACYVSAHQPSFQFCKEVRCTYLFGPPYQYSNIDSVFVYNNIFQNCGQALSIWEGNTLVSGPNCVRNVWFVHNTILGTDGVGNPNGAQVSVWMPTFNFFGNSYAGLNAVSYFGNIFSYDKEAFPLIKPVGVTTNPAGTFDYKFRYNAFRWPSTFQHGTDRLIEELPLAVPIDSLSWLDPTHQEGLRWAVPASYAWLTTDYFGNMREAGETNVGAVERGWSVSAGMEPEQSDMRVFPNPGTNQLNLCCKPGSGIRLVDMMGRVRLEETANAGEVVLDTRSLPPGVYLIFCGQSKMKWVRQP